VGRIDLPIYFSIAANFRKEVPTFEVVGFRGTYHTIIRQLGYAKDVNSSVSKTYNTKTHRKEGTYKESLGKILADNIDGQV
jgi:hypothetical protein